MCWTQKFNSEDYSMETYWSFVWILAIDTVKFLYSNTVLEALLKSDLF